MPEKDPAAVALGKRRQAAMTDEERRAFGQAARERILNRPPAERRAIARKSAMTRRRRPKWLKNDTETLSHGESSLDPNLCDSASLRQLQRELADLPDDLIERMAKAIASFDA